MYRTKRAAREEMSLDKELRFLSKMISPEDMDVLRHLKYKDNLRENFEDNY